MRVFGAVFQPERPPAAATDCVEHRLHPPLEVCAEQFGQVGSEPGRLFLVAIELLETQERGADEPAAHVGVQQGRGRRRLGEPGRLLGGEDVADEVAVPPPVVDLGEPIGVRGQVSDVDVEPAVQHVGCRVGVVRSVPGAEESAMMTSGRSAPSRSIRSDHTAVTCFSLAKLVVPGMPPSMISTVLSANWMPTGA